MGPHSFLCSETVLTLDHGSNQDDGWHRSAREGTSGAAAAVSLPLGDLSDLHPTKQEVMRPVTVS